MTFFNYTSASGGLFSDQLRLGQTNVSVFAYPGGPAGGAIIDVIRESGQEWQGIYPVVEVDPQAPDDYYEPADPQFTTAFNGTEYQVGATVTKTFHWASLSADVIRAEKDLEGQSYARRVAFSSAKTDTNPNVFVRTDDLNLAFYNIVGAFYADRHKDRVLGKDSSKGHDPNRPAGTPPGPDPDPTTYWARDVPVYLVNASNGNELEVDADEEDWGQVLKEVGTHILDTRVALRNYRADVGAKYDAYVADPSEANRTALVSLDPEDPAYGWPAYYDGPTNGTFRVL